MRHLSLSCCLFVMLESVLLRKSGKRIYTCKPLHGSGHAFEHKEQEKGCIWEGKAAVVNVFQLWLMWDLLMF